MGGVLAYNLSKMSDADRTQLDEAISLIDSGSYAESIPILSDLLERGFVRVRATMFRGYAYYKTVQYEAALSDFNEAIRLKPESPHSLFVRALCKEYLEDFEGALQDYERVVAIAPETDDAYSNMALIYEFRDELEMAKSLYITALQFNPTNPTSLRRLPVLGDWTADQVEVKSSSSGVLPERLSKKRPVSLDGERTALHIDGDYDLSIAHLSKEERSALAEAFRHFVGSKHAEAIPLIEKLQEKHVSEPRFYALRGYARYCLDDFGGAIADLTTAISKNSCAVHTLYLRASCFEEIENYVRAIDDCNSVISIAPAMADAHSLRGFCLEQLGQFPQAILAYKTALLIDGKDSLALAGVKELS